MQQSYGSLLSFGSIVRFKYIAHNTYTGIKINFHSKPTSIHGTVHKYDFNNSLSISHFSWLSQGVAKKLIYCLSHKFSYSSKKIDIVISGFSTK